MREVLQGVLDAQPQFTDTYTEAMRRRGELVRVRMTAWLRAHLPDLRAVSVDDLDVDARGHSAHLTLTQGSTTRNGDAPVDRPAADLRARADHARATLATELARRPDLRFAIDLKGARSKRARGYEHATVAAFEYRRDAIPSDDALATDLRFLVSVLGRLHATEDDATAARSAAPFTAAPSPEVSDALASAARAAGRRGSGQGFRLDQADRVAIETHAVTRARHYLEAQGFTVRDVGAVESYDLHATRPGERLHVEVKGSTSTGGEVVLTRNEVLLNAEHHPDTMLVVVSDVDLDRTTTLPRATGGRMRVVHPWSVAGDDLTPISYRYRVV